MILIRQKSRNGIGEHCALYIHYILGTETSSTTLEWLLLFMAEYPQVQEKVYQEIQNEIGSLRSPNLHDKSNTPYTLAAMEEVMRLCPMAFISFTRMAVQDVNIKGRLYPKGTQVYVNIRPIHRNAKVLALINLVRCRVIINIFSTSLILKRSIRIVF